jgi:hypothetical protein
MGRRSVLGAAVFIIGLLAFLTIRVAVTSGIDFLVIISLVVLAVLGVGVIGALTSTDE